MKRLIIVALVIALVMIFMVPIAFAGGGPNANACLGQLRASQAADYHDGAPYASVGDMLTTLHTPPAKAPGWMGSAISGYAHNCA